MKRYLILSLSLFITACSTNSQKVKSVSCNEYLRADDLSHVIAEARQDGTPAPLKLYGAAYPRAMLQQGKSGYVKYLYKVTPDGDVSHVSIIDQTDPAFGNAVVKSMLCWKFEPSKEGFTSKEKEYQFTIE